ncbi:SAV_915 family protein [Streptomyces sp. NPDC058657]|uniref:SAV_915 family protein n=1 Tax=unclassified Streptomyces TaxID=2593676 RepID=UPI00365D58CE
MTHTPYSEDPDPEEQHPAARFHVPVRPGSDGCALRFFRTPVGVRAVVAFTTVERLRAVLGRKQPCIPLSEAALRDLAGPLGVGTLIVDPVLTAPAAAHAPAASPVLTAPAAAHTPAANPVLTGPAAAHASAAESVRVDTAVTSPPGALHGPHPVTAFSH